MTGSVRIRRHRATMGRGRIALLTGAVVLVCALIAAVALLRPDPWQWRIGEPAAGDLAQPGDLLEGPPTRVRIPAIGIDAPLTALRMDENGELQAPTDYHVPGWYEEGTVPGDVGPAVIAGHLDSQDGEAIFYRLQELHAEDVILVQRGGKWLTFQVVSMGRYAKDRFPTAQVYGPTPDPQLRLITCGGWFDKQQGSYRDNVVVFAVASEM